MLNEVFLYFQSDTVYDPFAERRPKTVAEKEDEYRAHRRRMIISPERVDPFAEGLYHLSSFHYLVSLIYNLI